MYNNVSPKPNPSDVLISPLKPTVVQAAPVLDDEEDEGVEAPAWVGATPDRSQELGEMGKVGHLQRAFIQNPWRIHGEKQRRIGQINIMNYGLFYVFPIHHKVGYSR
jgi:hypothetical protein